jgi:hypothetical protein
MTAGKVNQEFIDFFTDPMRIPRKFCKNLDRAGERCGTLGFWKN